MLVGANPTSAVNSGSPAAENTMHNKRKQQLADFFMMDQVYHIWKYNKF
jgi:hypothetical protein